MSRKFVPSFLKEQGLSTTSETNTRSFGANNNRFSTLSDEKPIINTSRPAKEAPKLVPATLASITSNGQGGKGTYAAKMIEMAKVAANPNYVKPLDVASENDFPSLGGAKKTTVVAEPVKKSNSYASLARDWAKQKEDEEENERLNQLKLAEEEKERALLQSMALLTSRRRMRNQVTHEDEDDYQYDESSLAGDSVEGESPDESEPSEYEDEEDEYNQNVGWDGRKKDDLY
jgi:hypothetical protein